MFKRKLAALQHAGTEPFNISGEYANAPESILFLISIYFQLSKILADEKQVRSLVLWLEDQKIRHYKIDDREGLRLINAPNWDKHYKQFLADVACPFVNGKLVDQLEWLIGYAISLEYSDNGTPYV